MNRTFQLTPRHWAMACLVMILALHSAHDARADDTHLGISPPSMISLTGAVAVGGESNLLRLGSGEEFRVPADKALVLTDLVLAPQVFPPSGAYQLQVLPAGGPLSTALTLFASAEDPSSLQVSLTSGLVFRSGSAVKVALTFGSTPLNLSAFGYLVSTR